MKLHSRLFCCVLALLVVAFSVSISADTISLGSSLKISIPDQAWNSPNAIFSLRFLPSESSSSSSFVAGIMYSGKVPMIWSAGGGATVDASAVFRFQTDGNLRLFNGSGTVVWESNTAGCGVSSAVLEDSGNLVLLNNSSLPVWSSFNIPTDTIVQSQNFTVDMILRSGLYSLKLFDNGNVALTWNDDAIYWNQGLNIPINGTLDYPILRLEPIGMLAVFDTRIPAGSSVAYLKDYVGEPSQIENLWFLRLKNDGSLGIYSVFRGSGTETLRWDAVHDKCLIFGFCGELSICSHTYTSPICSCPSANFEPVDPNDLKKGCKRKLDLGNCNSGTRILELQNTQLLAYSKYSQVFSMQILGCQLNCQLSDACNASTAPSDGSGLCYYIPSGFIRGYHSAALPGTSFLKVCDQVLPNQVESQSLGVLKQSGRNVKALVLAVVVLVTFSAMIAFQAGLWLWCCRNSYSFGGMSNQYALVEYASSAPVQFSYKELHRVTNGFKEKLGAGGSGAVYKGILTNRTVVAVKQLEGIEPGEKQFRMEVATISSTHHLNLVRLVGFCSEGRHRLLVYELMKNGSLDSLLFKTDEGGQSGKFLNWEDRFKIAVGTAKGITYLHEECRDCIIHRDIKPENILLDENLNAKVSDLGLAKLINIKDHRNRTMCRVRGTGGYLAPEWFSNLPLTSKSDVFSYGMVLLEIASGRRNFEVSLETNNKRFSMWAYEEFEKGNLNEIVDKRLMNQEINMDQVSKVLQVSFWCIREQPSLRPTMGKVVLMIEGVVSIERPPAPVVTSITDSAATLTSFPLYLPVPDCTSGGRNLEKATSSLLQSSSYHI